MCVSGRGQKCRQVDVSRVERVILEGAKEAIEVFGPCGVVQRDGMQSSHVAV